MSITNLEGETLSGRFRLERQLGRGGYGSVFEAEQLSVGRRCAVKVLAPKHGDDETTEKRFRQEARTTSRLTHPNSIVIYDFGRDEARSLYWLAMELLDGQTLQQRLRDSGSLSVDRCLHVVRQVAESLYEAHEIGLVHRDIKPGNIMLIDRGGDPNFVKVIDFGIAKVLRDTLQPSGNMTETGRIVGTPKYMAPEQIREGGVDGRADMYALATVIYGALTGNVPFSEGTAMEIASRQLTERPPTLRELRPGLEVSDGFESVLLRALSKDPERRFDDVLQFVDALESASLDIGADTPVSSSGGVPVTADRPRGEGDKPGLQMQPAGLTTQPISGGATPTAEVGSPDAEAEGSTRDTAQSSHHAIDERTLETVAVRSPKPEETLEDPPRPTEGSPEGGRGQSERASSGVTRVVTGVSLVACFAALGIWWATTGGDDATKVTPGTSVSSEGVVDATRDRGEEAEFAHSEAADSSEADADRDATVATSGMGPDKKEASRIAGSDVAPAEESVSSADAKRAASGAVARRVESVEADRDGDETPRAKRAVTVRAIPWGDLYVDGRLAGTGSQIDVRVSQGAREFVLKQNGEVRARRTVDVSATSPKIIELVAD